MRVMKRVNKIVSSARAKNKLASSGALGTPSLTKRSIDVALKKF